MTVAKLYFAILIFLISTVSSAISKSNTADVLDGKTALLNMSNAMKSLNYKGTVVFLKNGKLEAMKYFHAVNNEIEQERLQSLNSPLREIIRNADLVSCHFVTAQQMIVDYRPFEKSFLLDMPKNMDSAAEDYSFELVGQENIALLPAYVITLKPKDNFRYQRKIWIEKTHFLPLKVVIYDFLGEALEQLVFTELEVKDSIPVSSDKLLSSAPAALQGNSSSLSVTARAKDSQENPPFEVAEMPHGFQQIFYNRSRVHNSDQLVDHMVLSDGFSSVSIYMENKNTTMQSGLQSAGAVNSFSRSIGDYELTVMGEVPAPTVQKIADGIKLLNQGS
jgi:sigma-E factor negative regulatory protein RseB